MRFCSCLAETTCATTPWAAAACERRRFRGQSTAGAGLRYTCLGDQTVEHDGGIHEERLDLQVLPDHLDQVVREVVGVNATQAGVEECLAELLSLFVHVVRVANDNVDESVLREPAQRLPPGAVHRHRDDDDAIRSEPELFQSSPY